MEILFIIILFCKAEVACHYELIGLSQTACLDNLFEGSLCVVANIVED